MMKTTTGGVGACRVPVGGAGASVCRRTDALLHALRGLVSSDLVFVAYLRPRVRVACRHAADTLWLDCEGALLLLRELSGHRSEAGALATCAAFSAQTPFLSHLQGLAGAPAITAHAAWLGTHRRRAALGLFSRDPPGCRTQDVAALDALATLVNGGIRICAGASSARLAGRPDPIAGPQGAEDRTDRLSPRERHIATILSEGYGVSSVAALTGLSEHTVQTYVRRIYRKLGICTRAELVHVLTANSTYRDDDEPASVNTSDQSAES